MAVPVTSTKVSLPAASPPAPAAVPQGVSSAPTTLETVEAHRPSGKTLEPGFFETLVVAFIRFIVLLFTPLWNGLFGKRQSLN